MGWLIEEPWPLVWACGGVALACLVALRLTQRGLFLFWALGAAALAGLLALADAVVTTDAERVGDVVHALASAVARSDGPAAVALLDPEVVIEEGATARGPGGTLLRGEAARRAVAAALANTKFDFVRVVDLRAEAGAATRQGLADFRVQTSGLLTTGLGSMAFATDAEGAAWSLGLREAGPGVWKVTRITAVRLPFQASLGAYLGGSGF